MAGKRECISLLTDEGQLHIMNTSKYFDVIV